MYGVECRREDYIRGMRLATPSKYLLRVAATARNEGLPRDSRSWSSEQHRTAVGSPLHPRMNY